MKFRLVAVALLLLAPMVILGSTSWGANGALVYLGMLPALIALMSGTSVALAASAITPVLMLIGLALRDVPWAGALFMAAVGVGIGLSSSRGWHAVGAFMGPQAAFALLGAPVVAMPSGTVPADSSVGAALALALWVGGGGLWATLVAREVLPSLGMKGSTPVDREVARSFAVALGGIAGGLTLVAMLWVDTPYAWWLLLTAFVVVQPFYSDAIAKTSARVLGTVAGAMLAAVLVTTLRPHPLIVTTLAAVLSGVALWASVKRPYWEFALFLTPAVVLKTAGGADDVLNADLERVAFTIVAALVCVVVLSIGHWVISRKHPTLQPANLA